MSVTVRRLRQAAGLTLDALAARSGVSRSGISSIERNETSPTAAVLDKLAGALGVTIAALFDDASDPAPDPVVRHGDQVVWTDPASGYVRRSVSPPASGSPIRITEVTFPAKRTVSFDQPAGGVAVHEQVWMLSGEMELTVGEERIVLSSGDCAAFRVDAPTVFRNLSTRAARYVVVTVADATRGRSGR